MIGISNLMRDHHIERIVFVPATELVPHDTFHAWPFDGWLTEHCGIGSTVEQAIADAEDRRTLHPRKAA